MPTADWLGYWAVRLTLFKAATVCAVALASPTLAQKLPNATAVSTRIGQVVEFKDDVKAVSYSRTSKGYYLNFGSAFPKQALSVWAPAKMYHRLPSAQAMVGRVVIVSGKVETTSDGPLIKIESAENFRLLPADESILSKPSLDGKQDRTQFQTAVWQVFLREDFDMLEALSQDLQQSRERLNDGSWLSEAFFEAFHLGSRVSMKRYGETEQIIAHWEQARPTSTVLQLIKARFHVDLAWRWRGAGYANTVTPEGWEGFRKELPMARQILETHPTAKMFPEYFSIMQTIALGQNWKREQYERLFAEAIRIEPEYYDFYCNKAYFLLPRWHGRKGEWEEFAEQMRQEHGAGGVGDGLYARIVLSLEWTECDCGDLFRESAVSWETTASGLEYLTRQYPESRYLKNVYANLAWKLEDRVRLRRLLPEIKADPDMTIWVNLENFGFAEKMAASDGQR
ncbi:MAG: hypothetical protein ABI946_08965 [Chthoniobacterales bacterium]